MAQRITTDFVNTNRPGAYFDVKVKSTPVGVATSGNVVIFGEATGGAAVKGVDPTNGDVLKDNYFTPDQLDRVVAKYISGPLVDCFRAIATASGDSNITGSANRIYLAKTNIGTRSESVVDPTYGTIKDKNYGVDGDKYKYSISQTVDESAPEITGSVIPAFGVALDSASFSIRVDGGAAAVITLSGSHADITELVAEVGSALPAGISCKEGTVPDTLVIYYDEDSDANLKGYGKSIELIDSTLGDLTKLGLVQDLTVSAAEPEVEVKVVRADKGITESFVVDSEIALFIGYEGDSATITIGSGSLSTTVSGGSGANLSVDLSKYVTLTELADYINAQTGYTASVSSTAAQSSPSSLDEVTGIGICSTDAGATAGRVKRCVNRFSFKMAQSALVDFEATAVAGLPNNTDENFIFLSGGSQGSTSNADIVKAITDLESININFVIPCFSRDASDDITDGLTDSSSAYTIQSINAAIKNHVIKMSTPKIKRHRNAVVSLWADFKDCQSMAGSMAHPRISCAFQKSSQIDSFGETVKFLPWHTAAIAVGMQVAGFYKSIVGKYANVISFEDPSGFDSGSPGDIETAIDSGLLFLEKDNTASKWVVDQTTYGVDTNFVYNSMQAMYASDLVSLDLAASFQAAFTGVSLADVDASSAYSFLSSKMDAYRKQKLIAASDDAPLGYRNEKIAISAPIMDVKVEIKLATAILFIPINIEISQIKRAS